MNDESSEIPITWKSEIAREFREFRRDIKGDFGLVHEKLNSMNERMAGHLGNDSIHRTPESRPCRYFDDHVKDHERSKAWTRGLVMLAIVNATGLLAWAASVVFGKQ